ncbi:MAG: WecB/TagA/CpsF family glycosyltransferase [Gammaproteobacteria bacterium]|nr:WecB/TagA/CpsF family glycosyltransferase [Gammaproteobacteria bacterium]
MSSSESTQILGVNIKKTSLTELVLGAHNAMTKNTAPITFACANPHSLITAQNDKEFLQSLNKSDQVVVDGVGLFMLAKYAGIDLGERITGHDYFMAILDYLKLRGRGKVFFFGSSELVLNKIKLRLAREFPMLDCVTYSPPFGEWSAEDNQTMIDIINREQPDVLWVGMTAPRQEKWVEANRKLLNVPVIGSIGAVFDFYAGTYPRAPEIFCRFGMEWLFRLLKEPKRMWKRNFISTPLFILQFFNQHVLSHSGSFAVYSEILEAAPNSLRRTAEETPNTVSTKKLNPI